MFPPRFNTNRFCAAMTLVCLLTAQARATVIQLGSGMSTANIPVDFKAELTITGNTLVIELFNLSSVHSQNPNDVLSSYYFDILNGANVRPTLTYQSAIGDVWMTSSTLPDSLHTANANLKAVAAGDNTWQFKVMNPALNPMLGFGIGTVGNNNLTPNNFMGNIVGGVDYSIYAGDVTTANLNNRLLVKEHAVFTFTGVAGFTEADISANYAFGLGTAPDSLITPEPASLILMGHGAMLLARRRAKV